MPFVVNVALLVSYIKITLISSLRALRALRGKQFLPLLVIWYLLENYAGIMLDSIQLKTEYHEVHEGHEE